MRQLAIVCVVSLLACSSAGSDEGGDEATGTSGSSDELAPFVLRCDPSADDPCSQFGSVACCSDDPAALQLGGDLQAYVTPLYLLGGGTGTPLFSGGNNPLSRFGYCLAEQTPPAIALVDLNAEGCRIPCNPTWSSADIATVCGPGTRCCQAVELDPADCVLDLNIGDNGCFRPVTGDDIQGVGSLALTNWSSSAHVTHQDPSGLNCELFVSGLPLAELGHTASEVLIECYRRLTVANQRGSCFAVGELDSCPFAAPDYVDACEQANADNFLTGCD
jgi:hypothetical protein